MIRLLWPSLARKSVRARETYLGGRRDPESNLRNRRNARPDLDQPPSPEQGENDQPPDRQIIETTVKMTNVAGKNEKNLEATTSQTLNLMATIQIVISVL